MRVAVSALASGVLVAGLAVASVAVGTVPASAFSWTCEYTMDCAQPSAAASAVQSTQIYAGLRWNFGVQKPALVTGVRFTNTSVSGLVLGAKLDAAFTLGGDSFAPVVRLLGVGGSTLVQGEAGFGIDTATMSPLFAGGIQFPYASFGANISPKGYIAPYVELNALSAPPSSGNGAATCPSDHPYQLIEVSGGFGDYQFDGSTSPVAVDSSYVRDGKACVFAGLVG